MIVVAETALVKKARKPRRKAEPVKVFTPNPHAWQTALAIANGDAKRLKALDANTVLVANNATDRLIKDLG